MARADILSILYSKKTTALDFNYDLLMAPPLASLIPYKDLEYMHKLVTSIKYTSKIEYKESEIKNVMECYGFKRFASGTHRVVYRHLDIPSIIAKISLNKSSLTDNIREYQNQVFLKPFCCKCFEVDRSGMIGIFERVEPILSREEFASVAGDIFDFINTKLVGKYVIDDIGTDSFMNYGLRIATNYNKYAFGPVLLDYPEVYPLDGNKLYCSRRDMTTGMICGGVLDYDAGFNTIKCKKCGASYSARELQRLEETHEVIKKGASTNMKLELRRGDVIVKEVDTSKLPTDVIEPPKKQKKHSSDQMSIIHNPKPRKYVHSDNNPSNRNHPKVEAVRVRTGLGLDTMSRKTPEPEKEVKAKTTVLEADTPNTNDMVYPEETVQVECIDPNKEVTPTDIIRDTREPVDTEFVEDSSEEETQELADQSDNAIPEKYEEENAAPIHFEKPQLLYSTIDHPIHTPASLEMKIEVPEEVRKLVDEYEASKEVEEQESETSGLEEAAEKIRNTAEVISAKAQQAMDDVNERMNVAFADALSKLSVSPVVVAEEVDPVEEAEEQIDEALQMAKDNREKVDATIEVVEEQPKPYTSADSEESSYNVDTGFIPNAEDELGGAPVEQAGNPFTSSSSN
jgi:hypothetical protein